jgi:hypothetical protein
LLDIPSDTCVLVVSDSASFIGIEIEDVAGSKQGRKRADPKEESTVAKMIKNKSTKFSNTQVQPNAIRRVNKDLFPSRAPVGIRKQ